MSCSPPSVPRNGFLEEVTSTIMFGCNDGYSPQGTMTAECVATDTWSPDPAQLECTPTTTTSSTTTTSGMSEWSYLHIISCSVYITIKICIIKNISCVFFLHSGHKNVSMYSHIHLFPIGSVNAGAIAGGVIVPIVCVALIVALIAVMVMVILKKRSKSCCCSVYVNL